MSGDWINYALFITKEIAEAVKKSSDDTKEAEAVKPEDNILQKFGIWDIYSGSKFSITAHIYYFCFGIGCFINNYFLFIS